MSEHIVKRHNKTLLLYHIVCPLKYRKSLITNEVGGNFWTSGYYANTVGQYSNEEVIRNYVENQGKQKEYKKIHKEQLTLF